jgi:hypothetical protein
MENIYDHKRPAIQEHNVSADKDMPAIRKEAEAAPVQDRREQHKSSPLNRATACPEVPVAVPLQAAIDPFLRDPAASFRDGSGTSHA